MRVQSSFRRLYVFAFVLPLSSAPGLLTATARPQEGTEHRPTSIVVNEIQFAPAPGGSEYIELFNAGEIGFSVDGLTLRDGQSAQVALPPGTPEIAPGRFLVIVQSVPEFEAQFPGIPNVRLTPWPALNNDGDLIVVEQSGVPVDAVRYDPTWHHPDLLDDRGISLERITTDRPSNDATNWTSSVATAGGTPGRHNSVRSSPAGPHAPAPLYIDPDPFSPDRDGHDDVVRLTVTPAGSLTRVRLRIYDLSGLLVRELSEGQLAATSASFLWDGRDDGGRRLRSGIYVALAEVVEPRSGYRTVHKRAFVLARSL